MSFFDMKWFNLMYSSVSAPYLNRGGALICGGDGTGETGGELPASDIAGFMGASGVELTFVARHYLAIPTRISSFPRLFFPLG